jgi:hypothetical protein
MMGILNSDNLSIYLTAGGILSIIYNKELLYDPAEFDEDSIYYIPSGK